MDNKTHTSSDERKLLCRACLSPASTSTMSWFQTKFENTNLYDIYKNCVAVEVESNDKLPQSICKSCLKKLVEVHEFKKQCQKSNETLKTALNEYSQSKNDQEATVIVVLGNDRSEIIKIDLLNKDETYQISYQEQNDKLHLGTTLDDPLSLLTKQSPVTKLKKTKPKRHIYKCPRCPKSFTSSFMKSHMRTHTKEKPYSCPYCQMKFSLGGNLKRHIKTHTGEKSHVCDICSKGFIQAVSLIEHKRTHTGETPYMCTYCGMQFSHNRKYRDHVAKHKMCFQCTKCSNIFATKTLLNQHMLSHGEKTFLCSYCGKGFVSNSTLATHVRTHTGARPYTCTECNKSYRHYLSLKSHKLTHTGEKPYSCQLCSKNFTQKSHLTYHERIHSGEKPYVCSFCKKAFSLKGNLTVHLRKHTGETPHVCDVCNKGFYDSTNLKKHKKRHDEVAILKDV